MKALRAREPVDPERATRVYYYWLLLSIFIEYARPASYFAFLRVPFLYSVIPIVLFIVSSFATGLRPMREIFADPLAKWILVFLVLIGLGVTHAPVTLYPFNMFKLTLGYALMFVMIARIITTRERMRGLFVVLLLAHLFLLAMNPLAVLEPSVRHYIIGATFLGDGNDFALSLCILIPCIIEVAVAAKTRLERIAAWATVVLLLLAIVASQSRGATIGLAAVMLFLWVKSNRKALSMVLMVVVLAITLLYAPAEYFSRMGTIAHYQTEGSAMGRVNAWKAAVRMAVDNPVLGVGSGTFPQAYGTRYQPDGGPAGGWLTAHSSYFLVLGELGFPGIITFLILVIGNILRNLRVRKAVLAHTGSAMTPEISDAVRMLYLTSAAMLGFAAAGTFLSAAYYPHVFVLTGLLIAVRSNALATAGMRMEDVAASEKAKPRRRGTQPVGR